MTDWRRYWNRAPLDFDEADFLRQVGKTVRGHPVRMEKCDRIVQQLHQELDFRADDLVLDLCCGNGLLTRRVALLCGAVVGVDYSDPLIRIAQKHHQVPNVEYVHASVLDMAPTLFPGTRRFTKVYMYEALQHFGAEDLPILLRTIKALSCGGGPVYFGSVPDRERIWDFYDSPQRRAEYYRRKKEGSEAIGTWWDRNVIESIATAEGFQCAFVEQHADLHTAHYRFDAKMILATEAS